MPRKKFHQKCHFQYAFDDNLSVTNVLIKQIFRAIELAFPPSPPSQGCAGGSSGSFQPQAVALVMAMKQ
jgi:hypothetical protein